MYNSYLSCAKYIWSPARASKSTLTLYVDIKALLVGSKFLLQGFFFIVLHPFKGLLSLWNVPLIESTTNPHLQFDISYSCPVNPMKRSLIPCIDLTLPLLGEIQHCSVLGTCVCILDVDIQYLWRGGGGSCWAGLLRAWLRALGRLRSGNQPPLSSTSIHTFSAASTLSARPNGA